MANPQHIKIIIIDDEPLARSIVKEYLKAFSQTEVVAECGDGFEGVKAIAQHQPGLIFLDIQMPKINGFEMLELIDNPPPVIFTTAFDAYAIKAFETHAIDYLLKPYGKERFDKAMNKFLSQQNSLTPQAIAEEIASPESQSRVVVKKGQNIVVLPVQKIHYLEAFDDYVKIFTADGFYLKKKTMAFFENTLDSKMFVRTHRSYLLNIQELTRIEPAEKDNHVILLKSGTRIPVSQTGYAKLKDVLGI
ncbi:MAG: Two-component transcriptional response regulator, LuxR family [Cytophagales bacterium]|jgi:two-component system LytT family response regulator|nr:response regulator [Bacteroidota bacterium]MBS1981389.1 response regulator [Bacteroidota bacterium]WHZ06796.1 MAG: Two-component transcriptional response regulator, LuxR family [Cytophagales bacterium]